MVMADISAGTGLFTLHFEQAVGVDGKVFAVEIAKNFLEHIKARASKASVSNVQANLCTEKCVELPESSINLALNRIPGESSDFVMGHVRPGQEICEAEVIEAGFEKISEMKDVMKENYFVKFRRK